MHPMLIFGSCRTLYSQHRCHDLGKRTSSFNLSECELPDTADIKGVKICEQAKGRWTNEWAACPRLNDPNYFWLTGEFTDHEPENEKNDHWALANGYVAITPTTVDVTAYHFMDELNKWFN